MLELINNHEVLEQFTYMCMRGLQSLRRTWEILDVTKHHNVDIK